MCTGTTDWPLDLPTCGSCGRHDADLKLLRDPDGTLLWRCHECLRRVWEKRLRWRRADEEREELWRERRKEIRDRLADAARRADAAPAGDWAHLRTCIWCKAFCNALLRMWRRQDPNDVSPPPFPAVARGFWPVALELGSRIRMDEHTRIRHEAHHGHSLRVEALLRVLQSWGARKDNDFELD